MQTFARRRQQSQKAVSSGLASSRIVKPGLDPREHSLLQLQRTIGNRAAQGLLARQADSFSPRDSNGVAIGAEEAVDRAASSSGQPLPESVRNRFEDSLETNLSGVRIHTGSESAHAATAVGAKAYTVGQDIHFGAGQ